MKTKPFFKSSVVSLFVCALLLSFSTASSAASFYSCLITKILPRAAGDVVVQVDPSPTESRFTETSRVIIDGTDVGASKLMTTILTGLVLGQVVTILVDNDPSFASPQIVQSAGLTAATAN